MKKKMFGLLICMLLIAIVVPIVEPLNIDEIKTTSPILKQGDIRDDWIEIQKLLASDGATDDWFGFSVSLDGDTALLGAPIDDGGMGSAYVFTLTNSIWIQQAKIFALDNDAGDKFGCSVSLDGDTALIGAYLDEDNGIRSGSAYVFVRVDTIWIQQAKLLASDGGLFNYFGISVSLSGDSALIGAYGDNGNTGAAYVFTRTGTNWTQQAKLFVLDGTPGNEFGFSVSLDEDTALIGAYLDKNKGSAYVFTRIGTEWTVQKKLIAEDGTILSQFGYSVSIDGDTALIGEPYHGCVYVFTRHSNFWQQQAKLWANDGAAGDDFGCSVSLDGDTALIGAKGRLVPPHPIIPGWAYIFVRYDYGYHNYFWIQQAKLYAPDGAEEDYFDHSVSIDENTVLIGAPGDDDNGGESGSAYVFIREIENDPPFPPRIYGKTRGKAGTAYPYEFFSTDPEGDEVSYYIEWGDENETNWTEFRPSGYPGYNESHSWDTKGTYLIQAKAKDIYGAESDWATLSVTMPCSYNIPILQFWDKLFERFPHAFPIIRQLMGY